MRESSPRVAPGRRGAVGIAAIPPGEYTRLGAIMPRGEAGATRAGPELGFALFPELDKHVVLRPPCVSGVS